MSKDIATEEKLEFDIESIFGDFTQEIPGIKLDTIEKEPEEEPIPDEVQEEIKTNSNKSESKQKKLELETDDEEDGEDSEEKETETESTDETDTSEEEVEEVEYSYKALATYLAEQGVIDFEDSDDIEDSPEILEEAIMTTAKNMVQEYKESIPIEGKLFLDYLEKGGDPAKYIQTLEQPIDFDNFDLEDEGNQKRVIKEFLANQGYNSEEIDEEIKDYEDALILSKKAKTAANKLKGVYSKQKEALIAQQELELKERQKQVEEYIGNIKSTIENSNDFAGLSVSKSDKKKFEQYLLGRDKEGLTQYERDLQKDPIKTQLELAYLKFKNYDFSKIKNQAKTEETKRIKNLIKTKETTVKGKSKRVESNKPDLSGFRKMEIF